VPPSNTAAINITANSRALPAALAAALGMVRSFGRGVVTAMSAAARAPVNVAKQIAHEVGREMVWGMTRRGMDALIEQGHEVMEFREQLTRFGLAARKTPAELQQLETAIRRTSDATGKNSLDILRGARAYVDIAGAGQYTTEKMEILARVSQAAGADIKDLAQVMFQLQHAMKIPDNELEETFGGLLNMSKEGTIHFAQMADEINELAPQFARFGVKGREGMNELAAMMQVARAGFATVAETGTGLTRIFTGLATHSDKFEKLGVKIFNVGKDGTKTFRPFLDILNDIQKNDVLGKDPHILKKTFGRSEAQRGMQILFEGRKEMERFEEAGKAAGVITQDLGTYTASASGRIVIAMEKAKNTIAEAFTVERVERFTGAIESMVDKVDAAMAAVGKLTDAWMYLFNLGKRIRRVFTDVDDENPFKAEGDAAATRSRAFQPVHRTYSNYDANGRYLVRPTATDTPASQAEVAAHDRDVHLMGRSASWSVTARKLMNLTPNDVITESAIRAAYAASRATYPGGEADEGSQNAGRAFLNQAPPALVDAIVKKIEEEKRNAPRSSYSQAAQDIADAVSKSMVATARQLAEMKYRELYGKDPPPSLRVEVDGRPIAHVSKNSPDRRRNP
jgi:TP901 family phage tail tape measure protein